jgi:hypothetical protein
MKNKISITYKQLNSVVPCSFQLFYTIHTNEQKLSINCYIEATDPHYLPWLSSRNFSSSYIKEENCYTPLFNESDYTSTVDAILFIEKANLAIMAKEGYPVLAEEQELV